MCRELIYLICIPLILGMSGVVQADVFSDDFETAYDYISGGVERTVVAEGPTQPLPADLGVTTQNWIGRSQYEGDAYFMGMLDEFHIYNRALSTGEIRYLAGDR